MADFVANAVTSKLILLYAMDKMDIPLTENSIIDICTSKNNWLSYMDCKEILWQLKEVDFINAPSEERESRYNITYEGRSCLSHYYQRIPASLREEISSFAKINRMQFKRNQEYVADFNKIDDGNYLVTLKIMESVVNSSLLEINIKTSSRGSALTACRKWKNKAPEIFEMLLLGLFEE